MVVSSPPLYKSSTAPGAGQTEAYLCDRTHPAPTTPAEDKPEAKTAATPIEADRQEPEINPQSQQSEEQLSPAATASAPAASPSPHRSSGQSQFPPRLSREPRPQNSPYANIDLPLFVTQAPRNAGKTTSPKRPIPVREDNLQAATVDADVVTLDMRPARPHVSGLWHRLRFNRFSPMASQRRSGWKPRKPRRGRPEGTKGAGSRSL